MENPSPPPPARLGWWQRLRRPSVRYSILALCSIGFICGILFWGGFNTALEATNSLEFCTSCHEMRDTVFQEYKETIHYSNRTGVRAICSDCHVPRDWGHKMARKAKAAFEIWGKISGTIDTPEKFEARRSVLAGHEWERMKASSSRECRNCHDFTAMAEAKQKPLAQRKHKLAQNQGKTCIDCHKGIAHLLPADYVEDED